MTSVTRAGPTGPLVTAPVLRPAADADVVRSAGGVLAVFNRAGLLAGVDVHTAQLLGRLAGEDDEAVLLAAAFAVRAPRHGHVFVDLAMLHATALADERLAVEPEALPWPEPASWSAAVAASPLVDTSAGCPLRLDAAHLYLDRYWRYEQLVLADLQRRASLASRQVDVPAMGERLAELFPTDAADQEPDRQRLAAAVALTRRLSVVAGGPGTGKTRTIAFLLAALALERGDGPLPEVALAAPTGKAAERVVESIRAALPDLPASVPTRVVEWLRDLRAQTLHRLLGRRGGSDTRFRHDRTNPLPVDVVIVDETSMVALSLMARLLEAVAERTQLVLVGDPDQLTSIEAGSVLGDLIGPAREQLTIRAPAAEALVRLTGQRLRTPAPRDGRPLGDAIVVLQRNHRQDEGSPIADLARAIQRGDGDAALRLLAEAGPVLRRVEDGGAAPRAALEGIRATISAGHRRVVEAALDGDATAALEALDAQRVLCAHRRGPDGVDGWVARITAWLVEDVEAFRPHGRWHVGQPVLVTRNDYHADLRNGDVGVVIRDDAGMLCAAFPGRPQPRLLPVARLEWYETMHAMTIHKSQGSQFKDVVVVLPEATSRILTRELLYTAVTRAERRVTIVGSEAAIRTAVQRPIQRASGLRARLWRDEPLQAVVPPTPRR